MNDLLQQLLTMGPAIGAGIGGNGNAMQAFMEGYQRTQAQLQQQARLKQQDTVASEDRQRLIERQTLADQNAAQDRARAGEVGKQQDFIRSQQAAEGLTQTAGNFDDPAQAKTYIESMMPNLMSVFGQNAMALGQPAVEQAQQTITGRQKKQVSDFVNAAMKVDHIVNNPDSDPEIQLPDHIGKILGKPSARLSEVQQFAQLPVGKPERKPSEDVSLQQKDMMVGGKLTPVNYNPKTGTYTDQAGKPVTVDSVPPKPTSGTDPEIADLRKELLRLQVENAGKEKEPNQAQFTAAGYAGRMEQAEPILTAVTSAISGMSLPKFEMQTNSWFARPTFQSPQVQSYMQAARNFINAVLRRESGAVISPQEFAEAKAQYLPIPGDDPQSLKQKAENRAYVFQTMKRSSGKAYEPPPLVPNKPGAGPQLRERRKFGTTLGEWNGKEWVEVKP